MTVRDRILAHLHTHPDAATADEIAAAIGAGRDTVAARLRGLAGEDRVRRVGVTFDNKTTWGLTR